MPRVKKAAEVEVYRPNSLVASAARITNRRKDRPRTGGSQAWQDEFWHFFDTCGELAFAIQWQANAMSQVKLRLVVQDEHGDWVDVPDDTTDRYGQIAVQAMEELFDGDSGQTQMMAALGTYLSGPGEGYLIGLPPNRADGELGTDLWRVVSNDEIRETGGPGSGKWELDRGDGVIESLDSSLDAGDHQALVIRIWRSHPRKFVEATSPCRAALPVLRELEGAGKYSSSTLDSRLAGAGILLIAQEMTFQTPNEDGLPPTDGQMDDFLVALTEAMQAALRDPSSAAARVPIVVKVPGAFLDGVKHITFDLPLSDFIDAMTDKDIRRLALALDMPPEVLLGQADSNHWSAWLISEDAIKLHVDPLADLIADAILTRYLWPAMQGPAPVMDPRIKRYRLVPDTTELRERAASAQESLELHTRMVISDAALLRESKFDPGDAPDDAERKRRFMELVAKGSPSPDMVAAALSYVMGQPIAPLPSTVEGEEPPTPVAAAAPEPTPAPVPAIEAPREPPQAAALVAGANLDREAAVLAGAEMAVTQAVERAWARAGKRGKPRTEVAAGSLDSALSGAWDNLPRAAALLGLDPDRFHAALDTYARGLLTTGAAHEPAILAKLLRERVLADPVGV